MGGRRTPPAHVAPCDPMYVHLQAAAGDYAETCLLPGDPNRARRIAEEFLQDVVQVNTERGLLGYTGTYDGRPVSVQTTGMGGPSAAIVVEELIGLGVKRLLRVGKCGGLQPDMVLGELVVALSAVPADGVSREYVGADAYAPTASWRVVESAVRAAAELELPVRVGPIASTNTFTTHDPDPERERRWAARGCLAVEMEAAAIFTIAAVHDVEAGCLLTVADVNEAEFVRISEAESEAAVERLIRLGLATAARL